jgi:hypothetical protein
MRDGIRKIDTEFQINSSSTGYTLFPWESFLEELGAGGSEESLGLQIV